jgi:hypothetical protein
MTNISPLLYFYFWEPVYFLMDESEQSFPGKSKELRGRWVGISEHIGNKMTYKIITDDTGEEICRSAIRTTQDTTLKKLREDPIELDKDLMPVEDILSPANAISNQIKSDALNDVQDSYFQKSSTSMMDDDQGSHFKQSSSPAGKSPLAPQANVSSKLKTASPSRPSTNKNQRHARVPKLKHLYPTDPSKIHHHYPRQDNCTANSGQTLPYSDDINNDATNNLPTAYDDDDPDDTNNDEQGSHFHQPTNPTVPSVENQQQFLKDRDTHIDDQPDSFVYLRENGENENPIWKEFEVTLKDGNGYVELGPDGKPMIAISPPLSDLIGRVFLTKPDERGEVNRARVVELINRIPVISVLEVRATVFFSSKIHALNT